MLIYLMMEFTVGFYQRANVFSGGNKSPILPVIEKRFHFPTRWGSTGSLLVIFICLLVGETRTRNFFGEVISKWINGANR